MTGARVRFAEPSRLAFGVALAVAVGACGGEARRVAGGARASSAAREPSRATTADAPLDAGTSDDTLETLAHHGVVVAAGMREEQRLDVENAAMLPVPLLRADRADLCARVAFVAARAGRAWLEDGKANVLAQTSGVSGDLGPRGPVCVRRGDALTLRFEASGEPLPTRLRVIAWVTP